MVHGNEHPMDFSNPASQWHSTGRQGPKSPREPAHLAGFTDLGNVKNVEFLGYQGYQGYLNMSIWHCIKCINICIYIYLFIGQDTLRSSEWVLLLLFTHPRSQRRRFLHKEHLLQKHLKAAQSETTQKSKCSLTKCTIQTPSSFSKAHRSTFRAALASLRRAATVTPKAATPAWGLFLAWRAYDVAGTFQEISSKNRKYTRVYIFFSNVDKIKGLGRYN